MRLGDVSIVRIGDATQGEMHMSCAKWIMATVTSLVTMSALTAHADSVADFYKGKQINVIVGSDVGGGYDVYTRLLARHMPRHVPGNPTMVVQNMPGAGSLRAANFVVNASPKDGTALLVMGAPTALEPLFGNKDTKFEGEKLLWIGNMIRDTAACGTWHNSGIASLDQIINARTPVPFGASGYGTYANHHAMVLKHMLGANLRVIMGFKGIPEMMLALERGELQAQCSLSLSTIKSAFDQNLKRGELKVLVQFGRKDEPYFGGATNFYSLLKTDAERQVADLFFGQSEISRPLIGPPGIPSPIAAALRKAMADTVADKAFLADAAKSGILIDFVSGEETSQSFAQFYKASPAVLQKAREIMGRN